MDKIRYIIVGSGWRSQFYVRIAKAMPERFEAAAMLCRTEEKARLMHEQTGVYTTISEAECQQLKPDFIVVAVDKASIFKVSRHWLDKGWPVLCETPAGLNIENLEDAWQLHCYGTRFQVAEQYYLYPRYGKDSGTCKKRSSWRTSRSRPVCCSRLPWCQLNPQNIGSWI